jgi:tripartite-type tricarboxylate transporter receptor subunit TctC
VRLYHLLFALASCLIANAQGQEYPTRPVRIVFVVGAGGVGDGMARIVNERMAASLGQAFVLEHRPGAGGNIAMEAVAKSPADGQTLLLTGPAVVINPTLYRSLPFDPFKDLVAISPIAYAPFALFVSGMSPANNVEELIATMRSRPGGAHYASVGVGTAGHLAAVLFSAAAGIEMTHVPYKSIQQAIPDLVSGEVQLVFNAYPPLAPMLQGGRLKLMGFATSKRLAALPGIPTLAESGLPGFEAAGWYLVLAPAATPRTIVARLNDEFSRTLRQPEVIDGLDKLGLQAAPMSLAETERFVAREAEKWARAVRISGAKAE